MVDRWKSRFAVLAAGVALVAIGCQPRNEYAPPPPPVVEVAQPIQRPVTDYLEFTGTTRAVSTVELRARVNGYLEEIHFEDGAMVEKGQLLFTIEKAPYLTKLEIAKADLAKARAALELAESELRRLRTLVRREAGTVQELEIKQAERNGAVAEVAAAEAAVEDAELQLGYCEIHAPIAGRIGRNLVDVGNLVQAEQMPLAEIESIDPIYVYFNISDGDLLNLRRERTQDDPSSGTLLGVDERPLEMGLGDEPGYPYRGRLDFNDLGVDPGTGTLQLRGVFPNEDRRLLPGLFTRIRTAVSAPRPRLLVPERALGTDQRGDYVLVVEKDVVEYRSVRLGRSIDGLRVVLDGLKGDEQVVVNGVQYARPGAPVDPKPADLASVGVEPADPSETADPGTAAPTESGEAIASPELKPASTASAPVSSSTRSR